MDREIVDVIDNAGTDAGWQRGIAVGWKVADIQADAGRADRALGERETANRCGRGCQATLPRIRSGGPTPIFWTLNSVSIDQRCFALAGSRLEAPAYQCVAPVARAFISWVMAAYGKRGGPAMVQVSRRCSTCS